MNSPMQNKRSGLDQSDRLRDALLMAGRNEQVRAAAPEMLEALKRAEEAMSRCADEALDGWDFGRDAGGALDCVRAAIAKAEQPKQWIAGHVSGAYNSNLDEL